MATNQKLSGEIDSFDLSSYNFYLPPELIAERPAAIRDQSRLLIYDEASGRISHTLFNSVLEELKAGDELVLNQTKVVTCRLIGRRPSGGKAEIFVLDWYPSTRGAPVACLLKASGSRCLGEVFELPLGVRATITQLPLKLGDPFGVAIAVDDLLSYLNSHGQMPIPPYIRGGQSDESDHTDYQTVFGRELGSVAAPTAGLHWTPELLNQVCDKGVGLSRLTLHVGRGTFSPIKTQDIRQHQMHAESFQLEAKEAQKIFTHWGQLTAVGTTALRALESIARNPDHWQKLKQGYSISGETDIFIYPGQNVNSIKNLITNFHLPSSSLFILICALIGRDVAMDIYQLAIKEKYRFFSYGDALMIKRRNV